MPPDTIKIYNCMADFYAAMGGTLEQDVDFTVHRLEEIHADVPMECPQFRANYYSILVIRKGRGRYLIDNYSYETKAQTIYFTNPGHLKGFAIYERSEGYVITFGESFLKQYRENIFDEFPFLIAEVAPPQYPQLNVFQSFDDLGSQLLHEFQRDSAYKFKIANNLLVVLLLKIKEAFWKTYDPLNESDSGSQIVCTFKQNLESHFRDLVAGKTDILYQVQDYAQMQHLHPSYLSTVIKNKTGRSVNTWIAEKTITEAQVLLSRSPVSVKEIAYQLGFKEPGHFSRFFKKHTGVSPSSFQQNLHAQI